jgi:hypothetical protein
MNFKETSEVDLKLKLLSGISIYIEDQLEVKPYTIKEIIEYGFTKYMNNLQWISLTMKDFIDSFVSENKKNILMDHEEDLKIFDFFIKLGGQELQDNLMIALAMIFRTDDVKILDDGAIAIDFGKLDIYKRDDNGQLFLDQEKLESLSETEVKLIHRDNFEDLVHVAKLQNYMVKPKKRDEPEANPADEETKKLMDHMKMMKEKVEAKKNEQKNQDDGNSEIDISDIISAVSTKSYSMNKFNIWDLTLYQLYDEYGRLELIDEYDFSIRAMMAGAEAKKIKLKHWSSKL